MVFGTTYAPENDFGRQAKILSLYTGVVRDGQLVKILHSADWILLG